MVASRNKLRLRAIFKYYFSNNRNYLSIINNKIVNTKIDLHFAHELSKL